VVTVIIPPEVSGGFIRELKPENNTELSQFAVAEAGLVNVYV